MRWEDNILFLGEWWNPLMEHFRNSYIHFHIFPRNEKGLKILNLKKNLNKI